MAVDLALKKRKWHIHQLQVLADSIGVEVFIVKGSFNPVDIAARAANKAKEECYDTVLIDTAGWQVFNERCLCNRIRYNGL